LHEIEAAGLSDSHKTIPATGETNLTDEPKKLTALYAAAAETINIACMEVTKILATLGAAIHRWFQAGIALALCHQLIIIGMERRRDLVIFMQVRKYLLLAHFPVLIPVGRKAAMLTDEAMPPHGMISSSSLYIERLPTFPLFSLFPGAGGLR
jgi:hypothetical protein